MPREERRMTAKVTSYPAFLKRIRKQLGLSQEDLARELRVSFATVNRWENNHVAPSRLARVQLRAFCGKMARAGKLKRIAPR